MRKRFDFLLLFAVLSAVTLVMGSRVLAASSDSETRFLDTYSDIELRGYIYDGMGNYTTGMCKIPLCEDGDIELLSSSVTAPYGVEIDGKYYAFYHEMYDYTTFIHYHVYCYVYDSQTWEQLSYTSMSSTSIDSDAYRMIATDLTYDETSETVYGCFFKDDDNSLYSFGYMDLDTYTSTAICEMDTWFRGVAADTDGTIYAITRTGNLVTVDKLTGDTTTIGSTGLSQSYLSSATIDKVTGKLFFVERATDDQLSYLYEIDKTTAKATMITPLFNNYRIQVGGLYAVSDTTQDLAPAAAEDLSLSFTPGSLTGTLTFNAPTTTHNGSSASGEIYYTVKVNKGIGVIATGATSYGENVSVNLTIPSAGSYKVYVVTSNSAGTGEKAVVEDYFGEDTPSAPSDVEAVLSSDNSATITWSPVIGGVSGGVIDPTNVRYTVTRYSDTAVVATNIADTVFVDSTLPTETEGIVRYYYEVKADVYNLSSDAGTSNDIILGTWPLPFEATFDSSSELDNFTIIDVNGDGHTWYFNNTSKCAYSYNHKYIDDDWLISPPIRMEKGKYYELTFSDRASSSSTAWNYLTYLEVYYGSNNRVQGMTNCLIERFTPTVTSSSSPHECTAAIIPESDGVYYIGFHAVSDTITYKTIYLDNISLVEGGVTDAPAEITCLSIVPAADKSLSAEISIIAPMTSWVGDTLTSITKIEVTRGEELIKTIESPTPGDTLSFSDTVAEQGTYTYSFTAYNAIGAGNAVTDSAYIGIAPSAAIDALTAVDTNIDGMVTLTWQVPTTDVNGLSQYSEHVTFNIYEVTDDGEVEVATALTDTTYTYQAVSDSEAQAIKQWIIYPVTAGGIGEGTASEAIIVGKPYSLPYRESFSDAQSSTVFTSDYDIVSINSSSKKTWTYNLDATSSKISSVDGDNGYLQKYYSTTKTSITITSGFISVEGTAPMLSFWTARYSGSAGVNTVSIREANGEWAQIASVTLNTSFGSTYEWKQVTASLTDYIGKTIQFMITTTGVAYAYFDDIYIGETYSYNLTATHLDHSELSTDDEIIQTVYATIENNGQNTAEGYTVDLYRDGILLQSVAGDSISSWNWETVEFTDTLNNTYVDAIAYNAVIAYSADECSTDNYTDTLIVDIALPDYPTVETLEGKITSVGVELSWQEPDYAYDYVSVTESFESYRSWSDEAGDWIFVDMDSLAASSITGNFELPNVNYGELYSYIIYDASYKGLSSSYSGVQPLTGNKCLISPRTVDGECRDWAISPRLSGNKQTISFYVYVPNYYCETWYICYSTTGTDIDDFKQLTYQYFMWMTSWTKYTATLPEGTLYFAILHYTAASSANETSWMFCIDDVSYESDVETIYDILGYNVYRDHVKINSELVTTTSYVDTTYTSESAQYTVTAVREPGESAGGNVVSVDNIYATGSLLPNESGISSTASNDLIMISVINREIVITNADGVAISVYTVDGKTIYSGIGSDHTSVGVQPGIYIIRAGAISTKVVVK